MEQKIFNSDKSRIKCDLKFSSFYWWLRSIYINSYYSTSTCASFSGHISSFNIQFSNGIIPTCTI